MNPFAHNKGKKSLAILLISLQLTGCAGGPSLSGICPDGNTLLDSTRALRHRVAELPAMPRELDKGLTSSITVEPGDVILVQPAELDSPIRLPGDQQVLPDGTITLGKYGRVPVAGRTLEEIEALVKPQIDSITRDAGPIVVRLINRQSKVYYVIGEVNAPGAYPLTGRETVLDALLQAGGLNDKASKRNILLARPTPPGSCKIVLPVCYNEIVQLADTSTNYQIAPGDRIFVPSRDFWKDKGGKDSALCCPDPALCDLSGKKGPQPQKPEPPPSK